MARRNVLIDLDTIDRAIPDLYTTGGNSDPIVHAKLFHPASAATWFITEARKEDGEVLLFGMCMLFADCAEWGYVALSELENVVVRGLRVERDIHFKPAPYSKVREEFAKTHGIQLP